MQLPYNSAAPTKSKKRKAEISQLAQDSFEAFEPFINVFDCGINGEEGPFHSISKADWDFFDHHQAGERGLVYPNGEEFRLYRDVIGNIYSAEHVHRHIEDHKTSYYTSGKKKLGLLYLDVDAHHPWQTDEYRGKAVLQKVFSFGYFRASYRGQNGYLKVHYSSIEEFNQIASYVQGVLKRCFLHLGILSDIEIKGTITDRNKSGSLAKLPFANKNPCDMRDETDSWNYPQLEKFKACPIVNARYVMEIARRLEGQIDEEKVRRFAEQKRALLEEEKKAEEAKKQAAPREKAPRPPKQRVYQSAPPRLPVLPASTSTRPVLKQANPSWLYRFTLAPRRVQNLFGPHTIGVRH